jgi:hypothetical protein
MHAVTLGRSGHIFFQCIGVLIGIGQQVAISLDYSICSFALGLVDRGIQLGKKPSKPSEHGSALSRHNVFCHQSTIDTANRPANNVRLL